MTNFYSAGEEGDVFLRQNGGRSCCAGHKLRGSHRLQKQRQLFLEEETEKLISLWSEEEALFNCRHKDYFKRNIRQNAINRILLLLDKQGKPMTSLKPHVRTSKKYNTS